MHIYKLGYKLDKAALLFSLSNNGSYYCYCPVVCLASIISVNILSTPL